MKCQVLCGPAFALAVVTLQQDGAVRAEAGAMVSMTPSIKFDTSVQSGIMTGLKRSVLGGEGLVVRFTRPGRVLLQTRSAQGFIGRVKQRILYRSD